MIEPDAMIITLGARAQHETRVSACDYAVLAQWMWSFKVSAWTHKRKIYARRHRRIDGQRFTVLMHQLILEELMGEPRPSDLHTPDHRDRDSLNNTRTNLRWATKSEQRKNQDKPLRRGPRPTAEEIRALTR